MHWLDQVFCLPETHPRVFNLTLVIAFAFAAYGLISR